MARLLLILILIVGPPPVLGAWDFIERYLAPRADLLPHWQTHDPAAAETIDHSTWAEFLAAHVSRDRDGVNRVAYGNVSDADRERLAAYIARLTAVPIGRFSRAVQLAYWINLYNALTVDLVLSVYPIDSILDIDISPGILAFGPWDAAMTQVEGRPLSLNDIEHRILRPIWRDARIHYALNCASVGCPNLQPRRTRKTCSMRTRGNLSTAPAACGSTTAGWLFPRSTTGSPTILAGTMRRSSGT